MAVKDLLILGAGVGGIIIGYVIGKEAGTGPVLDGMQHAKKAIELGAPVKWEFECTAAGSGTSSTQPASATNQASEVSSPPVSASNWKYNEFSDDMTGKKSYEASIIASTSLNFDSPYTGVQFPTLTIRKHPQYGTDVILQVDKGQFLCAFQGCKVKVRFDNAEPVSYSASEPSDHSTTSLFIRNEKSFIAKLAKADTVRIQAEFYQEGAPVVTFVTSGFNGIGK